MFNKLKEIINLKQRKKISVLNFMLVEKNNSISKLKKEVMRLTDLCNNYHAEKTA